MPIGRIQGLGYEATGAKSYKNEKKQKKTVSTVGIKNDAARRRASECHVKKRT